MPVLSKSLIPLHLSDLIDDLAFTVDQVLITTKIVVRKSKQLLRLLAYIKSVLILLQRHNIELVPSSLTIVVQDFYRFIWIGNCKSFKRTIESDFQGPEKTSILFKLTFLIKTKIETLHFQFLDLNYFSFPSLPLSVYHLAHAKFANLLLLSYLDILDFTVYSTSCIKTRKRASKSIRNLYYKSNSLATTDYIRRIVFQHLTKVPLLKLL